MSWSFWRKIVNRLLFFSFFMVLFLLGCAAREDVRIINESKRVISKKKKSIDELEELRGKLKRVINRKIRAVELLEEADRLLAAKYMDIGSYNLALEVLKEAEYLKPENAFIKKDIGLCYYFLGRAETDERAAKEYYSSARLYLEKAIELEPDLIEARYSLGLLLFFGFKDVSGAIKQMKIILEENPDDVDAHFALGRFYYEINELGKALNEYITLTRILPKNSPRYKKAEENIIKINRELGYYE